VPLGTKVGVGLGMLYIVLDEDPSPPPPAKEGAQPPIFGPRLLWPNGWPPQLLLSTVFKGKRVCYRFSAPMATTPLHASQ